jgi:hypothetical protein
VRAGFQINANPADSFASVWSGPTAQAQGAWRGARGGGHRGNRGSARGGGTRGRGWGQPPQPPPSAGKRQIYLVTQSAEAFARLFDWFTTCTAASNATLSLFPKPPGHADHLAAAGIVFAVRPEPRLAAVLCTTSTDMKILRGQVAVTQEVGNFCHALKANGVEGLSHISESKEGRIRQLGILPAVGYVAGEGGNTSVSLSNGTLYLTLPAPPGTAPSSLPKWYHTIAAGCEVFEGRMQGEQTGAPPFNFDTKPVGFKAGAAWDNAPISDALIEELKYRQ